MYALYAKESSRKFVLLDLGAGWGCSESSPKVSYHGQVAPSGFGMLLYTTLMVLAARAKK